MPLFCASILAEAQSAPPPAAQTPATSPESQKDQSIPDAPSAVQPAQPPPENQPQSQPAQPPTQPPPTSNEGVPTAPTDTEQGAPAGTPPPINIRTVPAGGATKQTNSAQEQLFTISRNVNQVMVPVTVTDESGRLISGLTFKDFAVLENGKKQSLNFFTSDPFALSAAVIIDLGTKDVDVQKINHTFPALEGAFSPFDEVSIYTYSNTVGQLSDWGAIGPRLDAALDELKDVRGQNNGPPVTSGPFGPQGPSVNGRPVDPSAPIVYTPVSEAHVLNDAVLRAALDLSKRDKTRRKVIFIISDGREYRSTASYRDVLRVLLTNNIIVYGIGVGGSAIPVYNRLEKIHLPRFGYSDILPKYVNATGGQIFNELTRNGMEDAYAAALGDARNQYTMGYAAAGVASGAYRNIEVLVDRPSCRSSIRPCVNVYAKDGYYPAPPTAR